MKKNALEWTVFAISLVLVLSVAGYLTYAAITLAETPPNLIVELGPPAAQAGSYSVPFTVRNQGSQSAADVLVAVTLMAGEEEVETSETTLPLVPYQSERSGVVFFTEDPAQGELVAVVKSYLEP